jgi:aldehyde dehydrogenase (NAD+)
MKEAGGAPEIVAGQKRYFAAGRTRSLAVRGAALRALRSALAAREADLLAALAEDLGKPAAEAYLSEVGLVIREIDYVLKRLSSWARPRRVRTPLLSRPGTSWIQPEPYGAVLVIAPWNYPVQLSLSPLVAALAAGNCAVLKPSELAPASSRALAGIIGETFDPGLVKAVEGGAETARALLEEKFDYIFYTGSLRVGRLVMAAAAKNLTPVTLELGGKNPCLVDRDVPVQTAGRRIAWGKFFNAGQTCVAPDYLLVHREVRERLLAALGEAIEEFYGTDPQTSPDYGRIINRDHHRRLTRLLEGSRPEIGGGGDEAERYLAPTVVSLDSPDHPLMEEEIFGPILPVLAYRELEEALEIIARRPRPLALYLFTRDRKLRRRVLDETSSGTVCVNDTISQITNPELPFGGVGESGMGVYHGRAGFETFSHQKSVMARSFRFDLKLKYPPYRTSLKILRKITRFLF